MISSSASKLSSRLPVSQFDLVSPPSKRYNPQQKRRVIPVTNSTGNLDAEFWELQQTVTMLKRRLKQCQANVALSANSPQLELVSTESLDAEEVFNFALRLVHLVMARMIHVETYVLTKETS